MENILHRRNFSFAWAGLCFAVLAACYIDGATHGLNTRITWGFEQDGFNMAIALSRLWFGLHEGYVAYQSVYQALTSVLVPNGQPADMQNSLMLSDPRAIQSAFDHARQLKLADLPPYSMLSPNFITPMFDDIGFADFYTLAFLIFGVVPTAMYNMYFLIAGITLILFFAEYWRQSFPLLMAGMIIAVFPVFFFSHYFDAPIMPSVNSNRFMSALGFVPILHVLCMQRSTARKLTRKQVLLLVGQALIFALAFSIRKTAQWQLIGLMLVAACAAVRIAWPHRKEWFALERLRLLLYAPIASVLVFSGVLLGYQSVQNMFLNPLYSTDCIQPTHGTWHSAYLGFSYHPEWPRMNPDSAAPVNGDGLAWQTYEDYMKNIGLRDTLCDETHSFRMRVHEMVMRHLTFQFLRKHPRFTAELYGYYKPLRTYETLKERLDGVSGACIAWCVAMSILIGALLSRIRAPHPGRIAVIALVFMVCSWMPGLFAYPIVYSPDDFWMTCIFAGLCISLAVNLALSAARGRELTTEN